MDQLSPAGRHRQLAISRHSIPHNQPDSLHWHKWSVSSDNTSCFQKSSESCSGNRTQIHVWSFRISSPRSVDLLRSRPECWFPKTPSHEDKWIFDNRNNPCLAVTPDSRLCPDGLSWSQVHDIISPIVRRAARLNMTQFDVSSFSQMVNKWQMTSGYSS